MKLALVMLGGAVGSGARYLVGSWCLERFGRGLPWGTLAVNVIGCFLITALLRVESRLSAGLFVALTTGVLGGFTTYSAFNAEVLRLLQEDRAREAAGYLLVTLCGCFLAGAAGYAAVRPFAP